MSDDFAVGSGPEWGRLSRRVGANIRARMIDVRKLAEPGSSEETLLEKVDLKKLPRHIAVIMDGNGRWARARRLPRVEGHRAGIASVREIVETSAVWSWA